MKIAPKFFVLCENYIVDDKQRPSVINMYDSIFAPEFPATHQLLKYAANIEVQQSKKTDHVHLQLKLEGSDGDLVFESPVQEAKIMPNMDDQISGAVFDIQMVPFPAAGRYTASLLVNDTVIATHHVQLRAHLPPEA